MKIIKKIIGVLMCLVGGYLIVFELAMFRSEYHYASSMALFFGFLTLGILLLAVGIKLLLPIKKQN